MKKLLIGFVILLHISVNAQYCPSLGPDQFLPCGVNSTTLTADLSQCGPGGPNPNQTTNYSVANIPYVLQANSGSLVQLGDDAISQTLNIGFTFCFFGNTYTQFYIGSNGWIGFSGGQPATFASVAIPNGGLNVPKNCIMGPWQDWHPGIGGQIRYQTTGVAPCRKLTVSWIGVPMYSCTNLQGTFHIVIYESTNVIENHIQSKPNCPQWALGTAVQGVHNLPGTIDITVPGRNSTQWTTQNNSHRWTPNGAPVPAVLTWYQVGNPVAIGTGPTITVTPPPAGANYTCHFVYPICNAGWATCNVGIGNLGPDTVFVAPGPPNLAPPIINFTNPLCSGSCDGTISITPIGGSGIQTISWNGSPPNFNLTGLCSGPYNFLITDAAGCTVNGNVVLTNPPVPTVGPIFGSDTVCFGSPSEFYSVPNLGAGWNYQWSSVGNIITNPNPYEVEVDWSSTTSGFIPGAIDVISINPNGCLSLPVSFDLTVFNVIPTITPISNLCEYDDCVTLNAIPLNGTFSGNGVNGNQFCPSINNIGSDTIIYTYIQSGCLFDDTITTDVFPRPIITPISPDNVFFELCEGDSVLSTFITASNSNGYNEWTFMNQTYQVQNLDVTWNSPGMFEISVVNWANGCSSLPQSTGITIARCPELLFYVPNSFTPDGDEHNNTFKWIFTSGFDPTEFHVTIFNRWGELIFESYDPNGYWDGSYGSTYCLDGIYVYQIRFGDKTNDGKYIIEGNVTMLR